MSESCDDNCIMSKYLEQNEKMTLCYNVSTVTCSKYNRVIILKRVYIHFVITAIIRHSDVEKLPTLSRNSIKQTVHISDSQSIVSKLLTALLILEV